MKNNWPKILNSSVSFFRNVFGTHCDQYVCPLELQTEGGTSTLKVS